jgi:hypothetical protein
MKYASHLKALNPMYANSYDEAVKNGVFWDVTPCGSCKNRRFGGTWRLLLQGDKTRFTASIIRVKVIKELYTR